MHRRGLRKFERRWTREVFNSMVPAGLHPDIEEGAGDLGADQMLDDFYRNGTALGAFGYRAGLWLIWFLPPLVLGKIHTFGALSPDERDRYLRGLYDSRFYVIRQLTFLMKLVCCTGYFRHPKAREAFRAYERDAIDLPLPVVTTAISPGRVRS